MDLSAYTTQSPAHNEYRSDTFTTPTVAMVQSLAQSSLGDAVYNEDSSTAQLEQKVAQLAGKPAGLYCVSGTLSNQIAIRSNLFQPPHSVLCDHRAHVFSNEAGGLATLSQAMVHAIIPSNGRYLTLEDDIFPNFVPDDGEIHGAPTKVISLENTLHGMIFPVEEIAKISTFCKENDVKLHLDGARLWNASVATGVSLKEYCSYFDSVSLCLSKSLGAPIGSVLVGDQKFITKANHFKKQNGGGIRQSGLLACMAVVAIDENLPQLAKTHLRAQELGEWCQQHNLHLLHPVETNFVFIDFRQNKMDPQLFTNLAEKYGVKASPARIAFHFQQSEESFETIKKIVKEVYEHSLTNPHEGAGSLGYY
ncbi:threonine aldolase [Suhomyces tanzawaensis NRRL Y-17324]|uniref:low-specificity L-threonine aldolase n=1 Tax=Suhomyces tanzawaensis NRRL Y-17324 TaxID=984487 RepID=A0A1E4SKU6_9ASCO|nr:threonine aldolase [Suhomyces tanzawaensis NRRL Y-17324]ODV80052.1 threonine aldolase [Suhomyces tanzawaensis NRRL Y-17324]